MNFSRTLTYLLIAFSLLLLSGGFMTAFQAWVVQQQNASKSTIKNYPTVSGIRNIVSTPKPESIFKTPEPLLFSTQTTIEDQSNGAFSPDLYLPPNVVNAELSSDDTPQKSPSNDEGILPTLAVFQDALVVQFPKQIASFQNMQKHLSHLILSPTSYDSMDWLTAEQFQTSLKPFLYSKVKDAQGQSIRYPKQAYTYAKTLIEMALSQDEDNENFVNVRIPLVEKGLSGKAKDYEQLVSQYSKDFQVEPALVYAIMEVESNFNPKAVSKSNAIGLMQIKPFAAGKDVFELLDGREDAPSELELFDSEQNIRIGVGYLNLLKYGYLKAVKNDEAREILTISSYNGGLSTVLKLFGDNPDKAIAKINRISAKSIYETIQQKHQSEETRNYLEKVLSAKQKFQVILS
ncbi:murein transglycosylase domain-containing protein [Thiosulfativibrio zosterae]|uniref:Transglycosylase SLT domain-containing protein n=1 Tax=Thiosulfativibrio zosterae TaxID=2675053 RepID=A0A6F8PLW3_9GAMM|nr:murein transglycosylase domain-containing protein [Thiosulfativibrio zosterae]BBP43076.1 hypothetical protein THMIRHAT_08220 [Thiosulfativibrio zosterae]